MRNFSFLTIVLFVQTMAVGFYTFFVYQSSGLNFLTTFLQNIQAINWSGQFNLDFLCYLLLSGFWVIWRNNFHKSSFLLAFLATIFGIMFLAPYLIWLIKKENGQLNQVLIGDKSVPKR